METKSFCMDSCIHDFGMSLVHELLGYGLLGFALKSKLVSFF